MIRLFYLFLIGFSITACKHGHNHGHHHGSANEFMHRSSTESLIERFESPERDAYQKPDEVIQFLGDLKGKKIMDIGAGSGYFSFRLAKAGASVIAADVNDEFQAHIKKRLDSFDPGEIDLEPRKIPYDNPSLANEEVDMVLVVNTYHHIEDRVDYFKKVMDGLKPDGQVVIIDYYKKKLPVGPPPGHKIAQEKVIEELKKAGYPQVEINTELLEYQYIVRATK